MKAWGCQMMERKSKASVFVLLPPYHDVCRILEILARPINAHVDKLTYYPNEMLELMCFVL